MPTNVLLIAGNAMGFVGLLVCLVTGVARLAGIYAVLGFETMTMFVGGGIGLLSAACFLLLVAMSRRD